MDIDFLDATAQAELVRAGEVSARELVEATISRIEAVNPSINAVIIPLFEKARREAERGPTGPFAGVPYVIKDLTVVSEGDLHAAGIAAVKAAGYRPSHDSHFVTRMRRAGFVLIGKANTPELGTEATTEAAAWGPCRNPWDLTRSVGGSSGGSAAAVAAGLVPVAHGNDAGGSVRSPAAVCGVVGLKPTRGRISPGPGVCDSDSLAGVAHEGVLARSVRDVAALLDVVGGRCPGDAYSAPNPTRPYAEEMLERSPPLRIGVLTQDPAGEFDVDREWAQVVRAAADKLAEAGHSVSEDHPRAMGDRSFLEHFMRCSDVAIAREIERFGALIGRPLTESDVEWGTWQFVVRAEQVTGRDYAIAVDRLRTQAEAVERWWEEDGWDILLTPTTGRRQALIGELKTQKGNPFVEGSLPMLAFTVPFNASGQPAISLPVGQSADGLPIGVQLVAAYGREDILLRVAAQLEMMMPWASRRPALDGGPSAKA